MISTLNEIMKCIEDNDTIIIHRHVRPDLMHMVHNLV